MVFIDWISPKEHSNFNQSFFEAIELNDADLMVFSPELIIDNQNSILISCNGGRVSRALKVFKLCWQNRSSPIFLLSYDSVLVPIIQIFCKNIFAYEHNTTPEGKLYFKHALWQKLFYWKIMRFAQFPSQYDVLKYLHQKCVYLGSPLRKSTKVSIRKKPTVYIAPSIRVTAEELYKVKGLIGNDEVIIRKDSFSDNDLETIKQNVNISPVSYIPFEDIIHNIKAIIIAVPSDLRGSGWFSEGIMHNIPIIITDKGMRRVFEETYPNYPYINPIKIHSPEELEKAINAINSFSPDKYISNHNLKFKNTFNKNFPC